MPRACTRYLISIEYHPLDAIEYISAERQLPPYYDFQIQEVLTWLVQLLWILHTHYQNYRSIAQMTTRPLYIKTTSSSLKSNSLSTHQTTYSIRRNIKIPWKISPTILAHTSNSDIRSLTSSINLAPYETWYHSQGVRIPEHSSLNLHFTD